LGKAVSYSMKQWKGLWEFLNYGELELSTNVAENSMRGIALGRKDWIHIGCEKAGPKVAAIVSVLETCRRLGVPVREYLLAVLPGMADRRVGEMAELTPMAWLASKENA
jgi:hypothetical protein